MSRLKHPVRAIREPFGKAGLIVACLALVAALGGTALAAAKLNGTQKKEVEKISKKFAGKPGANGLAGPQGTAGPAGAKGETGVPGTNGTNGASGKSVTVAEIAEGDPECEERGGAMVEQEGAGSGTEVCNGEEGAEGSPWTAGGTLPKGKTETGSWAALGKASGGTTHLVIPISFTLPLSQELPGTQVHFMKPGEPAATGCTGGTVAEPKADPGNLCVYTGPLSVGAVENASIAKVAALGLGASKTGSYISMNTSEPVITVTGTWAVTAPTS